MGKELRTSPLKIAEPFREVLAESAWGKEIERGGEREREKERERERERERESERERERERARATRERERDREREIKRKSEYSDFMK